MKLVDVFYTLQITLSSQLCCSVFYRSRGQDTSCNRVLKFSSQSVTINTAFSPMCDKLQAGEAHLFQPYLWGRCWKTELSIIRQNWKWLETKHRLGPQIWVILQNGVHLHVANQPRTCWRPIPVKSTDPQPSPARICSERDCNVLNSNWFKIDLSVSWLYIEKHVN